MSSNTASIRELRTNFRSVKRKIEHYGEIVITDNGAPAYVIKPVPAQPAKARGEMPDYYARVKRRQPKPLTPAEARRFWEEERGER
jgi:antitoxin (DNA-binding transcriptional repressor) of toxin-antitoxin stability system